MKKRMLAALTALTLLGGAQAMADDWNWVNCKFQGSARLASYADECASCLTFDERDVQNEK